MVSRTLRECIPSPGKGIYILDTQLNDFDPIGFESGQVKNRIESEELVGRRVILKGIITQSNIEDTLSMKFDPPLDPGISKAVHALRNAGVETYESCEGGEGHTYPEPAIRFHGGIAEGWQALTAALHHGLPVTDLRLEWTIIDNVPVGPHWEMVFSDPVY